MKSFIRRKLGLGTFDEYDLLKERILKQKFLGCELRIHPLLGNTTTFRLSGNDLLLKSC